MIELGLINSTLLTNSSGMKDKRLIQILVIILLASGLAVGGIWLTSDSTPVDAQCTTPSSCKTCHEVQGQLPVNNGADWHQQHAIFDFCAACHGGDRNAVEKDAAHIGLRTTFVQMAPTCRSCHTTELETCLSTYAGELGVDDSSLGDILEMAVSAPVGSTSILEQIQSGTLVGPQEPSGSSALSASASTPAAGTFDSPLNIILAAVLGCSLVGGSVFIALNERRLRRSSEEEIGLLQNVAAFIKKENWSPYAAGILLGLTGILAVLIGNHLLTASGPVATIASSIFNTIFPGAAEGNMYFRFVVPPELSWAVVLFIGIFFGGMLGALTSRTLRLRWSDDPTWRKIFGRSPWKRVLIGFVGALLLQYGASIAGGCTSGLAISGGMLLAPAAFLFMAGMFIAGIITVVIIYRRKY
jgi:hypothetical protein